MQRAFPTGGITRGLVKLELQYAREEIAGVGRVARYVVLRAGVKRVRWPFYRRNDTLIFQAQIGPGLVILRGRD